MNKPGNFEIILLIGVMTCALDPVGSFLSPMHGHHFLASSLLDL